MNGNINIKNLICVVLTLLVCLGLVSCSSNDKPLNQTDYHIEFENYSVVGNDGNYYITFQDGFEDITSKDGLEGTENCAEVPYLTFSSVKEFKNTVLGGKLNNHQMEIINSFDKNEFGQILTCDLNNLQTPTLPQNVSVDSVDWRGKIYYFSLSIKDGAHGTLGNFTHDKDVYNMCLSDYEKVLNRDNITITKTEILDGNKTVTYYKNSVGSFKRVRYLLREGNKTFTVDKEYILQISHSLLDVSETIPGRVSLYCVEGEKNYVISLYDLNEDPSDSWLLDFGLVKYVESEVKK